MYGFLYYLPGVASFTKTLIAEWGLSENFEGFTEQFVPVSQGPDKSSGLVLHAQPKNSQTRCGYYPETQKWIQWGRFWIGFETEKKPGPDDLWRGKDVKSYSVELDDGNMWRIPIARYMEHGTLLPQSMVMMPGGEIVEEISEKYMPYWEAAIPFYEEWMREGTPQFDKAALYRFALMALRLNYRIAAPEAAALKLFTLENLYNISSAAVGIELAYDLMREADAAGKKKVHATASGGSASSGGDQAS